MKPGAIYTLVAIFVLPMVFIFGCSGIERHEKALDDMQFHLKGLRKSQSETNVRLEELNNKLLLLQERVEDDRRDIKKLKEMAIFVDQPEDLKVVKLTEPGKQAVKKEVEKKKAEIRGKEIYNSEDLYKKAMDLFKEGKLEEAVENLREFVKKYPKNSLADNAQYWIGEVYYSGRDYERALIEFKEVVSEYPEENKVPDALLKIAHSHMGLNEDREAEKALVRLINRYPETEPAKKARKKLKELLLKGEEKK
ncbi:MAG: tol-pal system protein YbgF [Thermodesulfobacteriota bacterium]